MKKLGILMAMFFALAMVVPAWALTISLEPDNAQREVGDKVRVHIYANDAVNLVSMGVKVSFNKDVLQVESAFKNEEDSDTGWVMDADDGDPDHQYRTPAVEINNANGTVTMVGGNIKGDSTTGLNGKVLLGWIVFEAIGNGNSNLNVDLGRYNPNSGETYHNFVRLGGAVDEPVNVPGDLGIICVKVGACSADISGNGTVDMGDFTDLDNAMGKVFPDPESDVLADINGNGTVDMGDLSILDVQMGTPGCPSCP
ncbi:MAG: hypothetical protein KAR13_12675 [Desulfobulbaceae bacterium]|nr:hypothetical protein [Desulfobulbaceae bacterium]